MQQISAVWLKTASKTLYFNKFNEKFNLDQYNKFTASTQLQVQYFKDIVVSKKIDDLSLFVFGDKDANELVLINALTTIETGLFYVLEDNVTEETVMTNYMIVSATMTEIVDNGYLLTEEVPEVFQKVAEAGIVNSVMGGVKFLAKTILQ
ncbi:Conserved_hypothetical protein [Hexamita inflata]|uniref:Coatomer subunit zeta n=1 Tax=Hexamita inflata TaxID=28002 RepID=A0AA86UIV7_9EUKA|nr:Conserved hypothetical protein [Hexamita inflata]CAI9960055.1 Conserved hypothetical protein [Hexamita inflata]